MEFGDWVENAGMVLESLGSDDNVLVGSSMGGWISLVLASQEKFANKISGLILICPALNFIRPHYQQVYRNLSLEERERLDRGAVVHVKSGEYEELPVRKSFAEKSAEYEVALSGDIQVDSPVMILHGVRDQSVPYLVPEERFDIVR